MVLFPLLSPIARFFCGLMVLEIVSNINRFSEVSLTLKFLISVICRNILLREISTRLPIKIKTDRKFWEW